MIFVNKSVDLRSPLNENLSFRNRLVSTPDCPTRNKQETTNIGGQKKVAPLNTPMEREP